MGDSAWAQYIYQVNVIYIVSRTAVYIFPNRCQIYSSYSTYGSMQMALFQRLSSSDFRELFSKDLPILYVYLKLYRLFGESNKALASAPCTGIICS